jgi:hypothetical protein
MRFLRALVTPSLPLALVLALGACGQPGTAPPALGGKAVAPAHTAGPHYFASKAGSFAGVTLDRKTRQWHVPAGTAISANSGAIDLGPVGSRVKFGVLFKPAIGKRSLHGYGLRLFSDAPPGGTVAKNSYLIVFEDPNRLDLYRQVAGKHIDMNDTRLDVPLGDGRQHNLIVIVTHTSASRIDFTVLLDRVKVATGHDSESLYTSGTWGPVNLSNESTAFVRLDSVQTSR